MASILSNLLRGQFALLNPLIKRMDINVVRKFQDTLGLLGEKSLKDDVIFRDEPFDDFEASWAETCYPVRGKAILYLHGGAYTAGTLVYARRFGGVLAEKTGYRTLCVGYRLAPEDPYPAALEDAVSAYNRLCEQYAPEAISVVGESAGGGLCYCLCMRLKELGLPLPGRIATLSPWTDLDMTADYGDLEERDPLLTVDNLRYSAKLYAGESRTEPCVSPLYGELEGLPPSLILAGTDEILLRDSQLIAEKLLQGGCECELDIAEDMWHVYPLYGVPEAKVALERMRCFLLSDIREAVNDERNDKGTPSVG